MMLKAFHMHPEPLEGHGVYAPGLQQVVPPQTRGAHHFFHLFEAHTSLL